MLIENKPGLLRKTGGVQRARVREAGTGCGLGVFDVGDHLLFGVHGGEDEGSLGLVGVTGGLKVRNNG